MVCNIEMGCKAVENFQSSFFNLLFSIYFWREVLWHSTSKRMMKISWIQTKYMKLGMMTWTGKLADVYNNNIRKLVELLD